MAEERLVLLNLNAIARSHVFAWARSLLDQEPLGPPLAVVVAQSAVEVAVETAISFALQVRDVPEPVQDWIEGSTVESWSPTNERVQRLWKALTGDTITNAPGWQPYKVGTKLRHGVVHRAMPVTLGQAETFIDAAEEVVSHVLTVMLQMAGPVPAIDGES